MCHWNKIKREYIAYGKVNHSLSDEFQLLEKNYSINQFDIDENWNNLTDNEKQIKRLLWSKLAKKTEDYNNGFYRYEESVIDLYESITSCLDKLSYSKVKNVQSVRLKAFLCLIKKDINRYKDTRKIKYFYFESFKSIIYECLNCDLEKHFIRNINILYLESKLEILQCILSDKEDLNRNI
ncbi:hypothetical protein IUY40_00160 [Flavobacterium sp. ALJ2]|uniref:hypothetical protein n=1 Tax=Flavobacterium sp. ALJ2 TaxID=2786960 RepID=UPI0018A0AF66|nr:hypothetical protein [Flavobacterium sp. ALJ2]MBF7089962.1 hypothetical protein [Flavobacterium sp. ALJ2]